MQRNAALVVVLAVALTGGVVVFTVNTLGINTSTTDIISSDVPFRRNDLAFDKAFPQLRSVIVVVVDGTSPEAAEDAAQRLADRLGTDTTNFHDVYLPGAEPYFRRDGFLFLDVEALATLADRLAAIEPLLASLAADPSLRGLTDVLDLALAGADGQDSAELVELLGKIGAVARAIPAGLPLDLSWQSLLAGDGTAGPSRRFVLARPILDHGGFKPAAAAIDAIRAAARALDIDADHGLSVRAHRRRRPGSGGARQRRGRRQDRGRIVARAGGAVADRRPALGRARAGDRGDTADGPHLDGRVRGADLG